MRTMPAGTPARNEMNVYQIYAGDLSRRVESLRGNGRYLPLSRPGARPAVSCFAQPIGSELFEDE